MSCKVHLGLALACLLLGSLPAAADPSWSQIRAQSSWTEHTRKQHDDAGEVTVLKATVDGVECWRADAKVDVDSKYMMDVAMDIEGTVDWASTAHVSEAKILSRSGSTLEYYQLLDVPGWTLAKDRFWFVRGRVVNESGSTSFTWQKLDEGGAHDTVYAEFLADHEGAIEPPINSGGWHFTPVADGTEIRYHICTDSGGQIPQKIQSMATTS